MLRQRVLTAAFALAVVLAVVFLLPAVLAKSVVAVLMLAGAWEWSGFLRLRSTAGRVTYVALIALLLAGATVASGNTELSTAVLSIALVWWLVALIWAFRFPTRIPTPAGWVCGALVLVPAYLAILLLYSWQPLLLLFVLIIVWAADMGAYFAGTHYGRVKLAPKISPGKTWEGVIGGLALVAVLASIRASWAEVEVAVLLPFSLGVASISIIGDLTVSMFKRNAGLKDSGTLFPGHGGVLDRIDSVTAAAPLFALGVGWVGLR